MNSTNIIAIVVSYNGDSTIERTIELLRKNVDEVLVVDNGSSKNFKKHLNGIVSKFENVILVELGDNFGIGFALNRGVEVAKKLNYEWILTMDQDSFIDSDFIQSFCTAIKENPGVKCLTPNLLINGSRNVVGKDSDVDYAITSGNLVNMKVFDIIGSYNEELFIDCVDFDFSLRLKNANISIKKVSKAFLNHELGTPSKLPSIVSKFYVQHSALRRYYMFRNLLYMIRKYLISNPKFIIKFTLLHVIMLPFILIYDEKPLMSVRFILRGVKDFIINKFNKY